MALAALYVALGGVGLAFHLVARGGRGGAAAGAIVLSSSLLTAGFGLLYGLYRVTVGDLTPWLAVWVCMGRRGHRGSDLYHTPRCSAAEYPRQVAVVASITTAGRRRNFAYTSFYVPSAQPVQFDVQVAMGNGPELRRSGSRLFRSRCRLPTHGKTGLIVVATTYSVVGRKAHFLPAGKHRTAQPRCAGRQGLGGAAHDRQL